MTRREFLKKISGALLATAAGAGWLAKKVVPRKFVRAVRARIYPGSLRALEDIDTISKWSG